MHDVGPLGLNDRGYAEKAAQRLKYAQAAPLAFQPHDPAAFRFDVRGVVAHARRHDDFEAGPARSPRHGKEMGDEKPVLGNEIKKFGHSRSADRQQPALA